jgi:hypothetical protein
MTEGARGFRKRFVAGDHLVGTFIKTPATHPIEIIGAIGFGGRQCRAP